MLFVSRAERHLGHPPANSFAGVRPLVSGDTGQRQQSRAVPHEPCPQQVSFSRPKGSLKDTNYRNARDVPYIFSFCISLALICASDALSLPGLSPFPFPVICMHHLHSPHLLTAPTLFFSSLPFLCANHCFLCVRATRGQLPNSFRPTTPSIPFLHVVVHSITSQLSFFFSFLLYGNYLISLDPSIRLGCNGRGYTAAPIFNFVFCSYRLLPSSLAALVLAG